MVGRVTAIRFVMFISAWVVNFCMVLTCGCDLTAADTAHTINDAGQGHMPLEQSYDTATDTAHTSNDTGQGQMPLEQIYDAVQPVLSASCPVVVEAK